MSWAGSEMKITDLLPPDRKTTGSPAIPVKVYVHVQMDPEIVKRLKHAAMSRGYRLGEFLEHVLNNVLPKG